MRCGGADHDDVVVASIFDASRGTHRRSNAVFAGRASRKLAIAFCGSTAPAMEGYEPTRGVARSAESPREKERASVIKRIEEHDMTELVFDVSDANERHRGLERGAMGQHGDGGEVVITARRAELALNGREKLGDECARSSRSRKPARAPVAGKKGELHDDEERVRARFVVTRREPPSSLRCIAGATSNRLAFAEEHFGAASISMKEEDEMKWPLGIEARWRMNDGVWRIVAIERSILELQAPGPLRGG